MPLLSDLAEVLRTSCLGRLAAVQVCLLPALSIGQEEDESEEESERETLLLPTCKGWDGMSVGSLSVGGVVIMNVCPNNPEWFQ